MKPAEKRKAKMSFELLQLQHNLKNLPVFKAGLSEKQINNNKNGDVILQSSIVIYTGNDTGVDSASINNLLNEINYNDELHEKVKTISEFLNNVYNLIEEDRRKDIFNITKTISLMYTASKAIENKITTDDFANRVKTFFSEKYKSSGFAAYASSSTAKKDVVKKRNEILVRSIVPEIELVTGIAV